LRDVVNEQQRRFARQTTVRKNSRDELLPFVIFRHSRKTSTTTTLLVRVSSSIGLSFVIGHIVSGPRIEDSCCNCPQKRKEKKASLRLNNVRSSVKDITFSGEKKRKKKNCSLALTLTSQARSQLKRIPTNNRRRWGKKQGWGIFGDPLSLILSRNLLPIMKVACALSCSRTDSENVSCFGCKGNPPYAARTIMKKGD